MAVYRLLANSDGNGWENTVYSAILKGSFYKICEETGRAERKTIYTRSVFSNYIEIYNIELLMMS